MGDICISNGSPNGSSSQLSGPDSSDFFCSSRRRHTISLRDWSSDVCSSDLGQAGMSGVRMLSALGTALVGTALARAELDRDARRRDRLEGALLSHLRTARPYGLGSWEQTALRWARWAELWTRPELRSALRLALDADRALKSSTLTDEAGILEQLVLSWGVRAREAA